MDYSDENPIKVMRVSKIKRRLKKIHKRERRLRKAAKLKKLAEQGCIINTNINDIVTEKTF